MTGSWDYSRRLTGGTGFQQNSTPPWTRTVADNNGHTFIVSVEDANLGKLHTQVAWDPNDPDMCSGCHDFAGGQPPYHLFPDRNYWPLSYTIDDGNLDNARGTTVEAGVQNVDSNSLGISISDGTKLETLIIKPDRIMLAWSHLDTPAEYLMDTTDGYHTYRMTMQGTTVNVYVDCVLVLTGNSPLDTTERNIKFGQGLIFR